ncbi:MAG: alpha/beta hydrolase [Candidatus Pacebacteria bacterium]|nr:alpha/beta hydrolase [Candidatus Paceibacterota bacterium]
MNKKTLIILVVILAFIAISVGVFFVLQKDILPNNQAGDKCGDGICDEKEKANPELCPEDCEGDVPTTVFDLKYSSVESDAVKLDLYFPEKTCNGKLPLIVMIHGGAFKAGDKYPADTSFLTDNCYAVASINYRLSDEAIFPAGNYDVKSAVRWLRANADKYNLDSENFGVMGGSAGGYYSSFLGTTGDIKDFDAGDNLEYSSAVQAVVNQYGIADFSTLAQNRKDLELPGSIVESNYLGCDIRSADCTNAVKASPINYVSKEDPPFFILHGEEDTQIPINQSQDFYKKLQNTGVISEFISIPGAGHGGKEFNNYKPQILSFFNEHLK